jgi:hypothetical protein
VVERGPIRDMHKVWKLAHQPGGLKAVTDVELDAYVAWLRDELRSARHRKARVAWRESLTAAEAEADRRAA